MAHAQPARVEAGAFVVTAHTPNPVERPIFICGCHRTGTTLLQKSLSRHPDLDILPETKILAWLWTPRGEVVSRNGPELIRFIAERIGRINREWAKPKHDWRREQLRASAESAPARFESACAVMRHVLAHTTTQDSKRVGEKTPLHVFHISAILREFPDARIIITRRDLRAAYHSQATRNRTGALSYRPFGSARFVASWLMAERLARKYLSSPDSTNITTVHYEELAQKPREVFESLCSFLSIPNTTEMLDATVENSSFEDRREGFTTTSIDRWRGELPAETIVELERLAGPELVRAGYKLITGTTKLALKGHIVRVGLRSACAFAARWPRLTCYLWRDPRYVQHGAFPRIHSALTRAVRQPRVIVLGNHKSGTTAIAGLLAARAGLTTTIDLPRSRRREGYRLARGEMSIAAFYERNADLFEADLVKIPAMTFAADDIAAFFPDSQVVFVVRDPRQNIRSILNRRGISGTGRKLPLIYRIKQRLNGSPSVDRAAWGGSGRGYVGVLADRWNRGAELYIQIKSRALLVRYEDFTADKLAQIDALTDTLRLDRKADITDMLDHQFQPAGNRTVRADEFFGADNLAEIERVCAPMMHQFGYEPSQQDRPR
ncbi:MAG: sulfotransferase [Phycisphaera sp.]|nr:MAG: sulfotransferase [Phycisphaera sp.]